MKRIDQVLTVSFEYPVIFTNNVFDPSNPALTTAIDCSQGELPHRTMAFIDDGLLQKQPEIIDNIVRYFRCHSQTLTLEGSPRTVPGGETIKNDMRLVEKLAGDMLATRLSRHSNVVVIGGGAVLDAVGFATALVHRGLRLIRLPTTVLSQSDGGVGVKNGINFAGQKNTLGVFSPPFAVINDFEVLKLLDDRQWIEGIAEAFKVSIIRDRDFFEFLKQNAPKLRERDAVAMEYLVFHCAKLHLDHIRTSGDPFEVGHARPLDFGHWSAHKLETMSNFSVSHGEAVAVGILIDSLYAVSKGWLTRSEFNAIHRGFAQSGLPLWLDALDARDSAGQLKVFEGIAEFQEHLGGKLCITFPQGLGSRHEVHELDIAIMAEAIKELNVLRQAIVAEGGRQQ